MKNVMKLLCATMLLLSFAACTEKDNQPQNGNNDGGSSNNNSYSTLILGTWKVDQMLVNQQDWTPRDMQISFYEKGNGLMNNGNATDHNDFTWVINGNVINIKTDKDQFSFTIDTLMANECSFHGNYIKLDTTAINGDIRFHMIKENGGNPGDSTAHGDTNWINLLSLTAANSTTLSVTVTAYFDGGPTGIGVVYNTTGAPTVNDQVYNAFEHINMQTGETDSTIQRMQENGDGSRTVAVLLNNLQPGTSYYVRGYMQFSNGTTIYSNEGLAPMPNE